MAKRERIRNGGGGRTVVVAPLVRVEGRGGIGSDNPMFTIVSKEEVNHDASVWGIGMCMLCCLDPDVCILLVYWRRGD